MMNLNYFGRWIIDSVCSACSGLEDHFSVTVAVLCITIRAKVSITLKAGKGEA